VCRYEQVQNKNIEINFINPYDLCWDEQVENKNIFINNRMKYITDIHNLHEELVSKVFHPIRIFNNLTEVAELFN
jgi:hypothetical protein